MNRILLVGNENDLVRDIYELLADSFQVQYCEPDSERIESIMKVVKPEIMLLVMTNDISGMQYVNLESKKSYIPLITIVKDADGQSKKNVDSKEYFFWNPENGKKLLVTIKNVLSRENDRSENNEFVNEGNGKKKILAIDDTAMVLRTLKEILDAEYDVFPAISVKKAMKLVESNRFDLILLDYEMPEIDGASAMQMFKNNEDTKNIPIVFLTAVADKKKITEVMAMDPAAYILKPLDVNKILETVKSVIEK